MKEGQSFMQDISRPVIHTEKKVLARLGHV
jgi:hypothetical protein